MSQDPDIIFKNSILRSNFVPVLKETYKNIDIRAMLILKADDQQWHYVILRVTFTNQSQKTLSEIYESKQDSDLPSEANFKIEFESRNIEEITKIIDAIQARQLKINGIPELPLGTDYQNLYENDKRLLNDEMYTNTKDRDGYPHKITFAQMNYNPVKCVEDENINYKNYVGNFSEFNYYLDIEQDGINNPNNTIIIFPFYCKKLPHPYLTDTKHISKIRIHKSLISNSRARLRLLKQHNTILMKTEKLIDCIKLNSVDGMIDILVPRYKEMAFADNVEIRIIHEILGELGKYEINLRTLIPYRLPPSINEPMDKSSLYSSQVQRLLALKINELAKEDESTYLEFKASLRWSLTEKKISNHVEHSAIKEIPAFMNGDGGILVIGISDDGEILGLTNDFLSFHNSPTWDTWQQHLTNVIHDRYKISSEFDRYFHVRKLTHGDKDIAIISIEPTDAHVWMNVDGKSIFYVRRKNKTISLDGHQLATYLDDRFHKNR